MTLTLPCRLVPLLLYLTLKPKLLFKPGSPASCPAAIGTAVALTVKPPPAIVAGAVPGLVAGDGCGERRLGVAVLAREGIRRDGEGRLAHGQGAADELEVVVGGGQGALGGGDGVGADGA